MKKTATTDAEGHFFLTTDFEGETTLRIAAAGYYPAERQIHVQPNGATVVHPKLYPVADGAFAATVFVLDSLGDAHETRELITALHEMLELAGAKLYRIQKSSIQTRIAAINAIPEEGYYLRVHHAPQREGEPAVIAAHYRGNYDAENFLTQVLEQFGAPPVTLQDTSTPEIQQTNKIAMTLEIRTGNSAAEEARAIFIGAWRFLKEDGEIGDEKEKRFMEYLAASRTPSKGGK